MTTRRQMLSFEICDYEIVVYQTGDGPIYALEWEVYDNKTCLCCGVSKKSDYPARTSEKKYNFLDVANAIEDALSACYLQRPQIWIDNPLTYTYKDGVYSPQITWSCQENTNCNKECCNCTGDLDGKKNG